MKVLLYFDWMNGTRKELKAWENKIKVSTEETDVEYMGLYGSMNKKWKYCAMFSAESYDHFLKMTWKVPRPKYMTHYITELLLPSRIND